MWGAQAAGSSAPGNGIVLQRGLANASSEQQMPLADIQTSSKREVALEETVSGQVNSSLEVIENPGSALVTSLKGRWLGIRDTWLFCHWVRPSDM